MESPRHSVTGLPGQQENPAILPMDTSVVLEPALATPNARLLRRLEQRAGQCAIASLVWHELIYGVARLPEGKGRSTLDFYVQSIVRDRFPILPYDLSAADWHARERVRLEAVGKVPPVVDGQIAAIASTQNLVLVTSNAQHFVAFQDLEMANWSHCLACANCSHKRRLSSRVDGFVLILK